MARFVAAPRAILNEAIGEMEGWRHLADRILEQAKADCPEGDRTDERKTGPHLRDTLRVKHITGADPRILVGSDTRGDVLDYVHSGTSAHEIPVPSGVLAFVPKGGTMIFRRVDSVQHPGTTANPFILEAMRKVLGSA